MTRDYAPLVRGAATAAALVVAAKLSAVVTVANLGQVPLEVRFAFGFLPHIQVLADRPEFVEIVTRSTMAMAAVAALNLARPAIRGGADPDLVAGRMIGLIVAAETFALEVVRHALHGPVVAWPAAALTLAALALGAAAAAAAALRARHPRLTATPEGHAAARGETEAPPRPPAPGAPAQAHPEHGASGHEAKQRPVRRPGREVPTGPAPLPSDPFDWEGALPTPAEAPAGDEHLPAEPVRRAR